MSATADEIAAQVQKHYDALPAKRKPTVRANGLREWVPMAGIVAEGNDHKLYCLALATGMKCLPESKIPQAQGNVLHDWHAEVLAIRAFNRFVLDECKALLQQRPSEFLRWRTSGEIAQGAEGGWNAQPFTWRNEFRLHMYCSEAPCGDASMELIMASQEDATPWDVPPLPISTANTTSSPFSSSSKPTLPGRAFFSHLGVVRRKPARADAPPTLSKSCSDKLALRQCTSLLSSPVALLVDPRHVYLQTLVLPASRYSEDACRRAFAAEGRMGGLSLGRTGDARIEGGGEREERGGYGFRPFAVTTATSEFTFSQRAVSLAVAANNHCKSNDDEGNGQPKAAAAAANIAPSNIATAWTRSGLEETSLGGTLQGRKQFDPRGASFASRRKIWAVAAEVAGLMEHVHQVQHAQQDGDGEGGEHKQPIHFLAAAQVQGALNAKTYGEMKDSILLGPRKRIKDEARSKALPGWIRNVGDESFTL
ncbi:adenosine deaminase/editase [Hypoxylon sp. FL1150]|nr:adenosine deaminase/editase [Hypoxylon sp. FL1150]